MSVKRAFAGDSQAEFGRFVAFLSVLWVVLAVGAGVGLVLFSEIFAGLFF